MTLNKLPRTIHALLIFTLIFSLWACTPAKKSPQTATLPIKEKCDATSLDCIRLKAKQGEAEAQLQLGLLYWKGKEVPRDSTMAVKWVTESANQGNAVAQFELGHAYDKGWGVPQDFKLAATWFRRAAKKTMQRPKRSSVSCTETE